jgi:hypothetical protein
MGSFSTILCVFRFGRVPADGTRRVKMRNAPNGARRSSAKRAFMMVQSRREVNSHPGFEEATNSGATIGEKRPLESQSVLRSNGWRLAEFQSQQKRKYSIK